MTFKEKFILNFIDDNRYKYITNGLAVTLKITFCAVIIGLAIGFVIAIIRSTHDKTNKQGGSYTIGRVILSVLDFICKIYLTVIRGTPVVVQLLIIYFVIFASVKIDKVLVAIIAFSINSGAYVAEIVRSGIMSIDAGQTEAGRSLGLGFVRTMWHIIIPQAFKNVLPALANEFITLLKETSVSGYIALQDLTMGGDIIVGITYDAFMPLFAVAIFYLVMVVILSYFVGILERRLRSSER